MFNILKIIFFCMAAVYGLPPHLFEKLQKARWPGVLRESIWSALGAATMMIGESLRSSDPSPGETCRCSA